MTFGVKTEGTISLIDDEEKKCITRRIEMDGIETKMLTISNG